MTCNPFSWNSSIDNVVYQCLRAKTGSGRTWKFTSCAWLVTDVARRDGSKCRCVWTFTWDNSSISSTLRLYKFTISGYWWRELCTIYSLQFPSHLTLCCGRLLKSSIDTQLYPLAHDALWVYVVKVRAWCHIDMHIPTEVRKEPPSCI